MPDLNKLKSFLERTQRAMQGAVDKGDQAGVDQYEQFLDRATAVAERHIGTQGQQGPEGQPGAEGQPGLAQMAPKPQVQAPMLGAPVSKIEADLEGEAMPPPGSKRKPDQASMAMDNVLNAPLEAQKQETLADIDKTLAYGKESAEDSALMNLMRRIHSDTPSNTFTKPLPNNGVAKDWRSRLGLKNVYGDFQDVLTDDMDTDKFRLMHAIPTSPNEFRDLATGNIPSRQPDPLQVNAPPAQTPATTQLASAVEPPPPENEMAPRTGKHPPFMPEPEVTPKNGAYPPFAKEKPEYGEEPKFFSLHRLAQILLTGAPSAVRSFDQEKQGYENRKFRVGERQAAEKKSAIDQSWREKVQDSKAKVEANKAMVALLPHQAREAARPYLQAADNASKRLGDLYRMIPPPEANDPRILELQRAEAQAMDQANFAIEQAFKPLKGN